MSLPDLLLAVAEATEAVVDGRFEYSPEEIAEKAMPRMLQVRSYDQEGNVVRTGAGFIVSSKVFALTCWHVVRDAERMAVVKLGGAQCGVEFSAGPIFISPEEDMCLLWIGLQDEEDARVGEFEEGGLLLNGNPAKVGEEVYTIGNPFGLRGSFSQGVVSGMRGDRIQFTASISPGSSGGPLLDKAGTVLGVVSSTVEQGQNLNFAVSTATFLGLMKEWREHDPPVLPSAGSPRTTGGSRKR